LFRVMADKSIPTVKVHVKQEVRALAGRTAGPNHEKELPADFGGARNRLTLEIMRTACIQQIKYC